MNRMSENAIQSEQLVQPDLITSARTSLTPNDSEQCANNLSTVPTTFQTTEPCTVPKHSLENSSSPVGTSGVDIASTCPSSTSTSFSMTFAPRVNADSLYDRASSSTLRLRSPLNASSTHSSGYASDSATGDSSATTSASASFAGASSSSSSSTSATSPTSSGTSGTGAGSSSDPGAANASEETRNDFDCSICFDAAHDPVVSYCGHLFWCASA